MFFLIPQLTLPDHQYPPTFLPKQRLIPLVPLNIAREFARPKLRIRRGGSGKAAAFVSVPKTTMDEDHHAPTGQDDVRCSWEIPAVETKPEAVPMKPGPD